MMLSELLRQYPYLGEFHKDYPPNWLLPQESSPDLMGLATLLGIKVNPQARMSAIPNILGHEYGHMAVRESPSWKNILGLLQPSESLIKDLDYPSGKEMEEAFLRQRFPVEYSPYWPGLDARLSTNLGNYFTPEQLAISNIFNTFLKYGYGAGSKEGPIQDIEGWNLELLNPPKYPSAPAPVKKRVTTKKKVK